MRFEEQSEIIHKLQGQVALLEKALKERNSQIALLEQQLALFKKHLFGSGKSEKLDKAQINLELGEGSTCPEAEEELVEVRYERKKRKAQKSKQESYEHLPILETQVIEPEEVKADPQAYQCISEESTFELKIDPPKMYRKQIIRPKYKKLGDKSLPPIIAPAPIRPVQGIASVSLLVYIVLNKYLDHLPLFRQEKIFKRYGAAISRQNMVHWIEQVASTPMQMIRKSFQWLVWLTFGASFSKLSRKTPRL